MISLLSFNSHAFKWWTILFIKHIWANAQTYFASTLILFIVIAVNAAEIWALSLSLDGKRFNDINDEDGALKYRISEYVIVQLNAVRKCKTTCLEYDMQIGAS